MELPDAQWITSVAQALALFGVFAILPLSIAIMYAKYNEAKKAPPEIRNHCVHVHWVFVVTTVTLMVAAAIIQHLANNVTIQVLRGSVADLKDESDLVLPPGGGGKTVQKMRAMGLEDEYFETGHTHESLRNGLYRTQWILTRDGPLSAIVLGIRQSFQRTIAEPGLADPVNADARPAEIVSDKSFLLEIDSFPDLRKSAIKLVYAQGRTPAESIGSLRVATKKGPVPLTVVTDAEGSANRTSRPDRARNDDWLFVTPAYAQDKARRATSSDSVIRADGSYDSAVGHRITRRLQSDELSDQADAREVLAAHGDASCSFIGDALAGAGSQTEGRGVLIHNLAVSLEEIERRSPDACKETYLPFALAYYQIKDYPSASRFFARVPDANLRGVVLYNRSYAYYSAGGRDAAAIRGLRTYLLTSPPQPMRAASQVLLGRMLNRGGQKAAAAGEFGMALALLPEGSWLRSVSANDLAYIYSELFAQSEDSLRAAVLLADQALRFTPQQAAWIDTKGWLLYLLKDCNEAERLLSLAAAKAPSNRTIGAHLKQVRTERTGRCRG